MRSGLIAWTAQLPDGAVDVRSVALVDRRHGRKPRELALGLTSSPDRERVELP